MDTKLKCIKDNIPQDNKVYSKELILVFKQLYKEGLISNNELQKAMIIAQNKYK